MSAEQRKKIGTHNGTFHCDEVLACFMLKQLDILRDAEIVRTRDEETLKTCDFVVDVGAIFDAERNRFDHHQKTFNHSMHSLNPEYKWTTKLSSAGLVYYHFGHRVIAALLGLDPKSEAVAKIFAKVYTNFIEEIDAIDNGVDHCTSEPRYNMSTHLSARVKRLNAQWDEVDKNDEEDQRFHGAMDVVGKELVEVVKWYNKTWLPTQEIVASAVENRFKVDPSGEILEFKNGGCPWKEHVYELEENLSLPRSIKFVIYPDQSGKWRVQGVNVLANSMHLRVPLIEQWKGLRDAELVKASGFKDAVFVHANGFIGGAGSRETALAMAKASMAAVVKDK